MAWAAAFCIDALTCLGRLDEAEAVAAAAAGRKPPPGWIHTLLFLQARGALRVAQQRPADALDDLLAAAAGWRALGIDNPAVASWRTAAAAAHAALGHPRRGGRAGRRAARAGPQGRQPGDARHRAPGARRSRAAGAPAEESLAEAVSLLEATPARHELALALADLGAHLRRAGRRTRRQAPRCAAPWTSRSAPAPRRWPTRPGGNCSRPAPGPGAPPSPARTR